MRGAVRNLELMDGEEDPRNKVNVAPSKRTNESDANTMGGYQRKKAKCHMHPSTPKANAFPHKQSQKNFKKKATALDCAVLKTGMGESPAQKDNGKSAKAVKEIKASRR